MVMKKKIFLFGFGLILSLASCSPRWLLVNSNGIASYNRHTGQFEILWENHNAQIIEHHDTVYVDSTRFVWR